jgi:MFS family permease
VNEAVLWVSLVIIGLGFSTFGPIFMLYFNQYVTLTSRFTSMMFTTAGTAWLIGPYTSALLLEYVSHSAVFHLMMCIAFLAVVTFLALHYIAQKWMLHKSRSLTYLEKCQLEIPDESMPIKGEDCK